MKVSTKIYGGFALMIILMMVIVGIFFYDYNQISKLTDDTVNYRGPMQDNAQKLALNTARQAAAVRGFLASGNPNFKQDLDKATKEAEKALKYLNDHARNKQLLDDTNSGFAKFAPHPKKMIELYETQGQAVAVNFLATVAAPDSAALIDAIGKYSSRQDELNAKANEEIIATQKALTTKVMVILVIAIVLGIVIALSIARPILAALTRGMNFAESLSQGDFSQQIAVNSRDEIGVLLVSLNTAADNLRGLIKHAVGISEQVAASAEELTASAEQSAQAANQVAVSITDVASGASEQLAAANDTSAVVQQMSASIQQIAANTNEVAGQSAKAAGKANEGSEAVETAVTQMTRLEQTVITSANIVAELGERSKEIGQIVDTISGIAGQTNLLALNAAIEAARAGEQGRGFAVVAEEVRKLAEQSQDATKQIAALIGQIQGDTDKAVVAMNNGTREAKLGAEVVNASGKAFREIVTVVNQVSGQVKEISAAIEQMAVGSQQIVGSVQRIDGLSKKAAGEAQTVSAATEEQSASMEEIASSSQALAKLAEDLQAAVGRFRI